jgi:hypothetical protein
VKYRKNVPVKVLASTRKTMLINRLATRQSLAINGFRFSLDPYQVAVINTPL